MICEMRLKHGVMHSPPAHENAHAADRPLFQEATNIARPILLLQKDLTPEVRPRHPKVVAEDTPVHAEVPRNPVAN